MLSLLSDQLEQIFKLPMESVAKVRFSQPVLPDQSIAVTCETKGSHQIRFRCETPVTSSHHTQASASSSASDSQRQLVLKGLFTTREALPLERLDHA